jgi:superfamily II DNA or RNA helicase
VDLICAFIKWTGYRLIERELKALVSRGGKVRVLTTTYLGSTERRALDALVALGAEVRISYDVHSTRLHAKAWLFHRPTLSTAYVGSSNLTKTALVDGLEWNVRLSERDHPHLIPTFQATFEQLWNDGSFEPYDPDVDGDRFDNAVRTERVGVDDADIDLTFLDVRPYSYQQEVLDALEAERVLHSRNRNLVVMATGTGKTVVAALDYRRLRATGQVERLLFVAHRDEILKRSRSTFRHVLRDGSFGEMLVGGARPEGWDHVFASVQSLAAMDLDRLPASQFDMVIVDEFHHAEAPTYTRLLDHLQPKQLVGLTATPERSDGRDVTTWFDGRIAAELRLWEAIDRGMVCPFQYFGIADDVDLSHVQWKRGRYDVAELSRLYSTNHERAAKIVEAVRRLVSSPRNMRALGFCVSVDHAQYMARVFSEAGIPSVAVSATTQSSDRVNALRDLEAGRVNVVFAVDLFNEGVDLPHVDTVLFLRPTESSTLFLQQLGRGLRLADGKACLTALDFIGHQHAQFRFDQRFVALTGAKRPQLATAIANDFPQLPAGCHIELDRVAKEVVLGNVRQALTAHWRHLARDVRSMWPCTLAEFVQEEGIEVDELYGSNRTGWLGLLQAAGIEAGAVDPAMVNGARRMLNVDDPDRQLHYGDAVRGVVSSETSERRRRLDAMLQFTVWGSARSVSDAAEAANELHGSPHRQELTDILRIVAERTTR